MKRIISVRKTGKWSDILPIALFLSLVLTLLGSLLGNILLSLTHVKEIITELSGSENAAVFLSMYLGFIGIWIVFFIITALFKNNRPILGTLAFRKDGINLRGAAVGLLLGFLTNGFCILMSCLLGDIHLSYAGFRPDMFFIFLLAVTIQSGAEEIVDRSYLYQKLRRRYANPAVAIVVNSVAFASLHLLNPGIGPLPVIQIIAVGIVFSFFVYYFDSLWAAIMMHAGWNFTQSIVFGLPNSGIVSEYSLFRLDAASARNGIFYTVDFGVEGSIGAVFVIVILGIVMFFVGRRTGEKRDIWRNFEQRLEAEAKEDSGKEKY